MGYKGFIIKLAGSLEEVDVRCPKCKSQDIVAYGEEDGYYGVLECNKCGFKK